jgi:hypothetical protein
MKICENHYKSMRKAVQDLGMEHLISKSSEEFFQRKIKNIDSMRLEEDRSNWDPLASMTWNFYGKLLEFRGLEVIIVDTTPNAPNEGHACPLCLARKDFDKHKTDSGRCEDPECDVILTPESQPWDEWMIESCGKSLLEHATKEKLITIN